MPWFQPFVASLPAAKKHLTRQPSICVIPSDSTIMTEVILLGVTGASTAAIGPAWCSLWMGRRRAGHRRSGYRFHNIIDLSIYRWWPASSQSCYWPNSQPKARSSMRWPFDAHVYDHSWPIPWSSSFSASSLPLFLVLAVLPPTPQHQGQTQELRWRRARRQAYRVSGKEEAEEEADKEGRRMSIMQEAVGSAGI